MNRKIAIAGFFIAATALAQHRLTFDDLAAIRRIGAPRVSPDGKWIAYDASTIDVPANYRHSAIYLVPSSGGESRPSSGRMLRCLHIHRLFTAQGPLLRAADGARSLHFGRDDRIDRRL